MLTYVEEKCNVFTKKDWSNEADLKVDNNADMWWAFHEFRRYVQG